jgi:hypothetical protein
MNSLKRKYDLTLSAIDELTAKLIRQDDEPHRTPPPLAQAPLEHVLGEFGTLPKDALFLGAAYDGLPVLLNLNDPAPGPILITGDRSCGKTALLQMIAQAIPLTHHAEKVQYGVITNRPEEWTKFTESKHCMGIFSPQSNGAENLILSLADWAHHNRNETRFALLLIDQVDFVWQMSEEAQQSLRWLLLRGPNRRVWTFATLNAQEVAKGFDWLDAFRTRLLGAVKNVRVAESILPTRDAELHLLEPKREFLLNESKQWVRFWIPADRPSQRDESFAQSA